MTYRIDPFHIDNVEYWRNLLCDACRCKVAALAFEGRPLCISCADNGLEWEAVSMYVDDPLAKSPYPYEH